MLTLPKPSLEHLYKMLSNQSSKETELGEILVKIIKRPFIPASKNDLCHPQPTTEGQIDPVRLRQSKLTQSEYSTVRDKWMKIISDLNKYPGDHGMSFDRFMLMIYELFGCDSTKDRVGKSKEIESKTRNPEMPITKESVHHLVRTGNPWHKTKPASTLQVHNLKFISCFTQDYSFEQLKEVGDNVVKEYQEHRKGIKIAAENAPVKLSLDLSLAESEETSTNLYLSHEGKITNDFNSANNLRSLTYNLLSTKGKEVFLNAGISAEEILMIITERDPALKPSTIENLAKILEKPPSEVFRLLLLDINKLNGS